MQVTPFAGFVLKIVFTEIHIIANFFCSNVGCGFSFEPSSNREAQWPSDRASDSGARDRGFDPHSGRCVVSLRKIHIPPKKYW